MVHRREVDGEVLVLGNQGALFGNAMTWWDHGTGSVWSQPLGEAIMGPLEGTRLEPMSVTFTSWDAWRGAHPETLALDAPARSTTFDLSQMLIVLDFGSEAAGYPVPALRESGVVNDVVAGVEVAVVIDPADPDRWSVFSRRLGDRTVELAVRDARLVDRATGTEWDPVTGRALDGELEGRVLGQLPGFTSFPDDFRTFWPESEIWRP